MYTPPYYRIEDLPPPSMPAPYFSLRLAPSIQEFLVSYRARLATAAIVHSKLERAIDHVV